MSLDRLKKLLIKVNEEGEVASPDGTLSDLGNYLNSITVL